MDNNNKVKNWGILDWRKWHYHVKYVFAAPAWIWYTIKSGNVWFFTAADPSLTFGGMEGEGKREMYEQLPEGTYPKTIYIDPGEPFNTVIERVEQTFSYPFIVKPDIGMMGFMFRKISNAAQLKAYHQTMSTEYIVQSMIQYGLEVAVMYHRMPGEQKGKITGLISKEPAFVMGDGKSTLQELILAHSEERLDKQKTMVKFQSELNDVLPIDFKMRLSDASNRSQGGIMHDQSQHIDEELEAMFDRLSLHAGKFYYGRYDILCNSIEDLKKGTNYSVLEFNGTGAGPQHFHTVASFKKVIDIIIEHWRLIYIIAKKNRQLGVPKWGFLKGLRHLNWANKNLKHLQRLDKEFPAT